MLRSHPVDGDDYDNDVQADQSEENAKKAARMTTNKVFIDSCRDRTFVLISCCSGKLAISTPLQMSRIRAGHERSWAFQDQGRRINEVERERNSHPVQNCIITCNGL